MSEPVFVFGSNLAGVHGAGAARFAMEQRGAEWGVGAGRTGNAYAIPTKDRNIVTLPISSIARSVAAFIAHAREHPGITFQVTPIGCGLAGYRRSEIAPLFEGAPPNCRFEDEHGQDWRMDQ